MVRIVSAMIWHNPSIRFSDLFTNNGEPDDEPTAHTKPKLNSHVLAAFKYVESTRISVMRRQQQHHIQQQQSTNSSIDTKKLSTSAKLTKNLIESISLRADYLLDVKRLDESMLTNETFLKPRIIQTTTYDSSCSGLKENNTVSNNNGAAQTPSKQKPPKCESHPIYSIVFDFVFDGGDDDLDVADELTHLNDLLATKRCNAELLAENLELVQAHIASDLANTTTSCENHSMAKQNIETLLVFLSSFFSTSSQNQFTVEGTQAMKPVVSNQTGGVSTNNTAGVASSSSATVGKKNGVESIDPVALFPPSLKFQPNNFMDSLYGCGVEVERRLRKAYFALVKCLMNYANALKLLTSSPSSTSSTNLNRLETSLNCYITVLLSVDWDLDDLPYLNSCDLNVVDYLIDTSCRYMPITSNWSAVMNDLAGKYKTPSDLLEDLFALSRERFQEAVKKSTTAATTKNPNDATTNEIGAGTDNNNNPSHKLAMLEEIDEEENNNDKVNEGKLEKDIPVSVANDDVDSGGEKSLFDSESFDLNLFPRMYHSVFASGGTGASKFDTDSLIKCLTFDIRTYEHYEKYIVARYMFWKYFSKLKTNFYCDSCSIILTSNRFVYSKHKPCINYNN